MESSWHQAFEEHLGIFLFALFLSVVTCFIAWYRGYFRALDKTTEVDKIAFRHVVGAFLIYLALSFFVTFLVYFFLSSASLALKEKLDAQINALKAWVNIFTMSVVFIALIVYLKMIKPAVCHLVIGQQGLGSFFKQLKNFGMGFLTLVICFPLVIATAQLSTIILVLLQKQSQEQIAVRFLKAASQNPVAYFFSCLFVVLVIPAIEELLFRGFLQNWLSKVFGAAGAIVSTSLIFAFFHFSKEQGWGNLEIIPSLFVLACFAGYIYFRQKSIFASIGLHCTYNALNVLLMTFAKGAGS